VSGDGSMRVGYVLPLRSARPLLDGDLTAT
jgi:hypothetical protein